MNTPVHRKAPGPRAVGGSHLGPAAPAVPTRTPKSKNERLKAIKAAINGELDEGNPGHFTDGGVPQIAAIEAVLGWRPAADERDAAWAAWSNIVAT